MDIKKRPDFLSSLCILTFAGSTVTFIGYFLAAVLFEQVSELIIKYSSWNSTDTISPVYFTALMALSAISLTGAIRMWKLHRDGFFLYSFAQFLIIFLPVIWIGPYAFSATNMIFSGLFIFGYGMNFKRMR